ncbi:MAG: HNH endonuclease, partial [Phycisphaerae bacterium]|nr:HNH endonuclease [Phycisphaerae bacterium]
MHAASSALNANVLVLNRMYMAIRVTSARRAFSLLCRELAEVISVEDGRYSSYDFPNWTELSEYRELFSDDYDWVSTVRMSIPVPKIIRLFGYDRLP